MFHFLLGPISLSLSSGAYFTQLCLGVDQPCVPPDWVKFGTTNQWTKKLTNGGTDEWMSQPIPQPTNQQMKKLKSEFLKVRLSNLWFRKFSQPILQHSSKKFNFKKEIHFVNKDWKFPDRSQRSFKVWNFQRMSKRCGFCSYIEMGRKGAIISITRSSDFSQEDHRPRNRKYLNFSKLSSSQSPWSSWWWTSLCLFLCEFYQVENINSNQSIPLHSKTSPSS